GMRHRGAAGSRTNEKAPPIGAEATEGCAVSSQTLAVQDDRGLSPKGQGAVVHTRDHKAGPRILCDSQSNAEAKYRRDDPGDCHNTAIAPSRFLNSRACGLRLTASMWRAESTFCLQ